jgi:bifunctional UDP-N-acetylglucosamine pyrophosphorylase/glucosamine-1-phosphate N-acetyltransferase
VVNRFPLESQSFGTIAKREAERDNYSIMTSPDTVVVILAAGKGTRLKSDLAKVLHRAGGRPLVEHVVRACQPLGAAEILVVVGHQAEDVSAAVTPLGAKTVLQEPQAGTGHAMQVARRAIGTRAKYVLVVPGDAPLIRTETLAGLMNLHRTGQAAATILSAKLENPAGYGRIIRKPGGSVAAVVEEKAADESQRAIQEINSSVYCFTLEKLWPCLEALRPENFHNELYLTDAIALLNERGEKVLAQVASDANEILGCNNRVELAEVDRIFRRRKAVELMESGVTIYLPDTVLVDPDVEVGRDSLIEPGVQLLGKTRIGPGCTIRTGSVLVDAVLAEGVHVRQHCVIASSMLGPQTTAGPFAHIREGAELKAGARVGNFVEVKKSTLHEGVKAMHLTYLGDATIGRNSNIGAGTITCNYDGTNKNATIIGERVFVGSDSALVAPLKIGDGAYIAAGSTVTENVPADALAIARGRQINKEGWVAERRARAAHAKSRGADVDNPRPTNDSAPKSEDDSGAGEKSQHKPASASRKKTKPFSHS